MRTTLGGAQPQPDEEQIRIRIRILIRIVFWIWIWIRKRIWIKFVKIEKQNLDLLDSIMTIENLSFSMGSIMIHKV